VSSDQRLAIGPSIRTLQAAFPGMLPVDGCGFLAYSCATARELHPLPCLRLVAKTRKPKDISKNGKYWREKFTGRGCWKSMAWPGVVSKSVSGWPTNRPVTSRYRIVSARAIVTPTRYVSRAGEAHFDIVSDASPSETMLSMV
jgi:hypothetical protein